MSSLIEDAIAKVRELSTEHQDAIATMILEAIESEQFLDPLTEAHRQDLRRRLEAYRDDPKAGAPWEEVKARLGWDERFARVESADIQSRLADEALEDMRAGRVRKLDLNDL